MKIFRIITIVLGIIVLFDIFFKIFDDSYKNYLNMLVVLSFFMFLITNNYKKNEKNKH